MCVHLLVFWACAYVFVSTLVDLSPIDSSKASTRKQGLVVNWTTISLFHCILLCLNCSLPHALKKKNYCSFALPLFWMNLPPPLFLILLLALPCSSCLSFCLLNIDIYLNKKPSCTALFLTVIPNYLLMIPLAPSYSPLFLWFPGLSLITLFFPPSPPVLFSCP